MSSISKLACKECDLLVSIPLLEHGHKAICPRCDFVFTRYHQNAASRLIALSTTSMVFMVLTLIFPFLILNSQGREKTVYFLQSLSSMGEDTYLSVVLFMITTTLVIPTVIMLAINYVVLSSRRAKLLPFTKNALKLIFQLQAWNMAEIFLLGILVSMVKIASLAHVEFGWSFFAFILYILSMATTRLYLDKYQLWRLISNNYGLERDYEQ